MAAFADVDAAFEEDAVFDGDAGGDYVSGEGAVAADVDPVAGGEVAAYLAEHDDLAGVDVGGDDAIATNGDAIASQIDGAFDPAVNVKRFRTGDLALNDERFSDGGLLSSAGNGGPLWSGRRCAF